VRIGLKPLLDGGIGHGHLLTIDCLSPGSFRDSGPSALVTEHNRDMPRRNLEHLQRGIFAKLCKADLRAIEVDRRSQALQDIARNQARNVLLHDRDSENQVLRSDLDREEQGHVRIDSPPWSEPERFFLVHCADLDAYLFGHLLCMIGPDLSRNSLGACCVDERLNGRGICGLGGVN
jgi:hypothetical protein